MSTIVLAIRLFLAAHPAAHATDHAPAALMLDLSTPDAPESEFPTISAKGRL